MRSIGNHDGAERRRFKLFQVSCRVGQPSFCRGETHPPRHPGSKPNNVKATLSGIHSVTVRKCAGDAED